MSYLLLSIFLIFLPSSRAQMWIWAPDCINTTGNYTSNNTYQSNLITLLSSLSQNIDLNGFYNASFGQNPDRAYATALCRGDTQLDYCRSCIQNATLNLVQDCPNYRQAIGWQQNCTLRYSDENILGIVDTSPMTSMVGENYTSQTDVYMSDLRTFLDNVTSQAADGGSMRKVGYGSLNTVGFLTIYALEQCTPDMSRDDCLSCLRSAAQILPRCCYTGGRVLMPSCNLRYEYEIFYNETRLQELLLVPVSPTPAPSQPPGNVDNNRTPTIIIVIVSIVAGLITTLLIGFLIWRRNKKPKKDAEIVEEMDEIGIIESLQYDFLVIKAATNDFSKDNILGQGGFGAVYKGKLQNGQEIAVKRLSTGSGQGDLEFKNEVMLLARLQHRNLVRLFGFSLEGTEKLLIYEFVQNASLDQFIFDKNRRTQLDWTRRYKIITGIARGILYLHEDSRLRIIHRDLKASNVLLDGEMHPKIADFGMARLFVSEETQGNTNRIVGTYGYMAPEYATRGHFSVKYDVFSFGVLILETISGQKNNCCRSGDTEEDLISNAWGNWCNGTATNMVDPILRSGLSIPRDILRCIHIGLLCVQESAVERPTMTSIVSMLNNSSITLPLPSRPAYYMGDGERVPMISSQSGDSVSHN